MEIETRQLHQVIAQLRNARKNTKETVDSALADSTSQKELIDKQQQEIEHLTEQLKKFIQRDTENTAWQDEVSRSTIHISVGNFSYMYLTERA